MYPQDEKDLNDAPRASNPSLIIITTNPSPMRSDPLMVGHRVIAWFGVGPVVISS